MQFVLSPVLAASPLVKSGKVLALGVTTPYRAQALPDVPTIREAGLPDFGYEGWYGMLAPSKTPRAIINRLAKELAEIVEQPETKERIANLGAIAKSSSPKVFDKVIHDEIETRRKVWKAAGVKAE